MEETDIHRGKGAQVVITKQWDLYRWFGKEKAPGEAGVLTGYFLKDWEKDGYLQRKPAVLILPGGGYGHVSAREAAPVALRFLARGYAAFVLDYSIAPHGFPVSLREAAMAMAFLRSQADALGLHGQMVAAIGFSAGGHLCGMLGTLYDSDFVQDLGKSEELRPNALGLCYPVAVSWGRTHEGSFENLCRADETLRQKLSLEKLVRRDMPPVFLWHTRSDASVPCRNSLLLATALEEAGVDFALHIYRLGPHGLSTADALVYPAGQIPAVSPDVPHWPEVMMDFFGELGFSVTDREEIG